MWNKSPHQNISAGSKINLKIYLDVSVLVVRSWECFSKSTLCKHPQTLSNKFSWSLALPILEKGPSFDRWAQWWSLAVSCKWNSEIVRLWVIEMVGPVHWWSLAVSCRRNSEIVSYWDGEIVGPVVEPRRLLQEEQAQMDREATGYWPLAVC